MKYFFKIIISVLLCTFSIAVFAENYTQDVLKHKLRSPLTDPNRKIEYIDSLLGMKLKAKERDSLLVVKTDIATSLCAYDKILSACKTLGEDKIARLPIDIRCRVMYNEMVGLARTRRKVESIALGDKLYNLSKPDSLIYYNAQVDYMRFNFLLRIDPGMAKDFIRDVEKIYADAKKKNLSANAVDNIYRILLEMQSNEALNAKDYRRALEINNSINLLSMTPLEKLSYDQSMALLYMHMDEFDEAEKIFKESLDDKIFHYNHGVAVMNYMHMLNMQGRYQESLDVSERYAAALPTLNRDMYYSYVLANKAEALAHLGHYPEAYNLMYESRLMSDSIQENDNEIEGIRLIDYFSASKKSEQAEKRVRNSNILLWIMGGLLGLSLLAIVYFYRIGKRREKECALLRAEAAEEILRHQEMIEDVTREHSVKESRHAATSLKLAELEERNNKIKEIISDRSVRNEGKIKLLAKLIGNVPSGDNSVKLFEEQMESIHSQFFQRLIAKHPDLTRTETRMCAYIIMNLSNKEIASMTNRTTRAVESVRYRISKKLDLPENESLLTYLRKFM